MPEQRAGLEVRWLRGLAPAADVVVTTRRGGTSAGPYASLNLGDHVGDDPACVAENRRRLAAALSATSDDLVLARQVHGTAVATVRHGAPLAEADVLVTTDPDAVLVVLVADCVPIVLLDREAGVLALVHAGWRGTARGVARAAVDALVACGGAAARTEAVLGPSISAAAYEVGHDVVTAFTSAGLAAAVIPRERGGCSVDLRLANALQLRAAGIPDTAVTAFRSSTDGGATYFSDRAKRPCGRFAMAARLRAGRS